MLKIIFGQKTTHLFYIGSIQALGTASAVFYRQPFFSSKFKVQGSRLYYFLTLNFELFYL